MVAVIGIGTERVPKLQRFASLALCVGVLAQPRLGEAASKGSSIPVGAVPAWVKPLPMPARLVASGSGALIHDEQERFAPGERQAFVHLAYGVSKPSDVQQGSELSVRYAPDFERLTLNFVRLYRDGKPMDALRSADIRVLDTEVDRERFLYDAGQNVVIVLEDVRPGDAIEWAYTVFGQNPAEANHVLAIPRLGHPAPVKSQLIRLLTPSTAKVRYRLHGGAHPPAVTTIADFTEFAWSQSDVPAVEDEGDVPSWHVPGPWAEVSDFSSWGDVAEWARPLYTEFGRLPSELEALIEQWRRLPTDEAKLLAAVRYVQEEIRYLGMQIGPHSLIPHPPNQTYLRRFGDCKDKTLLLVAVLRQLGIVAVPALVSSRQGRRLTERLPSPLAFDHVITKVTLAGRVYWFDSTVSNERGDLRSHAFSEFHFALPIEKGTVALEALLSPPGFVLLSEIEENYELGDLASPIELTVKTVLRGARADDFRARVEQQTLEDLAREYSNFFAKRFDGLHMLTAPVVQDDQVGNVVRVEEHYRIASLFRDDEVRLTPWSFEEVTAPPEIVQRKTPLHLVHPFAAEHRIILNYTQRPDFELPKCDADDGALRFVAHSAEAAKSGKTLVTFTLRSLTDAIEIERVQEHLALRRRIDRALELRLRRPEPAATGSGPRWSPSGTHLGAAMLGGLGVVLLQAVTRRKRRLRCQSRASGSSTSGASESTGASPS